MQHCLKEDCKVFYAYYLFPLRYKPELFRAFWWGNWNTVFRELILGPTDIQWHEQSLDPWFPDC